MLKKIKKTTAGMLLIGILFSVSSHDATAKKYPMSIKSNNGRFYAYIVLLFNENPHFVNLIQKDNIPLKVMAKHSFHIKAYKNYLKSLKNHEFYAIAKLLLSIYLEPQKYKKDYLRKIEKKLTNLFIVLKFSKDLHFGSQKIILEYCIFGKKTLVDIKHPIINIHETIYNIQPYIYYDEFSTSNSTFYYDMIYINDDEVNNDALIAKRIQNNKAVKNLYFVGSPVTDNITFCLKRAFSKNAQIRDEIWKMFVIHEITHKIINNKYNNYDQIKGEVLSLCSTIYSNPYLGLSVMYSYLNYNSINPHRIAAIDFIKFLAQKKAQPSLSNSPEKIKSLKASELQYYAKLHFMEITEKMKVLN